MLEWALHDVMSALESCVAVISLLSDQSGYSGKTCLMGEKKIFYSAEELFKIIRGNAVFKSFLILRYSALELAAN